MKTYDEQWTDLESFHEAGTIAEFIAYMKTDDGKEWLSPTYSNYLIRRDTVRKAAFSVMERSLEDST